MNDFVVRPCGNPSKTTPFRPKDRISLDTNRPRENPWWRWRVRLVLVFSIFRSNGCFWAPYLFRWETLETFEIQVSSHCRFLFRVTSDRREPFVRKDPRRSDSRSLRSFDGRYVMGSNHFPTNIFFFFRVYNTVGLTVYASRKVNMWGGNVDKKFCYVSFGFNFFFFNCWVCFRVFPKDLRSWGLRARPQVCEPFLLSVGRHRRSRPFPPHEGDRAAHTLRNTDFRVFVDVHKDNKVTMSRDPIPEMSTVRIQKF